MTDEPKIDQLTGIDLQVDIEAARSIDEAGKWAKFLSVTALCGAGILLLAGLFASEQMGRIAYRYPFLAAMSGNGRGVFLLTIIIVAAIMGFLFYLMYDFAQKSRQAVYVEDADLLAKSYKSLKLYFIISTIIAVLTLLLSLINLSEVV